MDLSEPVLDVLQLGLLGLLYLFFLRVVRAVWVETADTRKTRAPKQVAAPVAAAPRPPEKPRGIPTHAVIIEPASATGTTFDVTSETTIGRGAGCNIALDDTYASSVHARLFVRDGALWLEDLGSTNGTRCNGQQISAPVGVSFGDLVGIGGVTLELVR
jgi:pSer/pThr/pTyr-binding forkhead associated (FHA) protein